MAQGSASVRSPHTEQARTRSPSAATAHYVERSVRQRSADVALTRLARGLPVGGELEYADGETIAQSFTARRQFPGGSGGSGGAGEGGRGGGEGGA